MGVPAKDNDYKKLVEAPLELENALLTMKNLTEAEENDKYLYKIYGPVTRVDKKNRNDRVYPDKVMSKAIEDVTERKIPQGKFAGELDHPMYTSKSGSLSNLAIKWDRVYKKNGIVYVEGGILKTEHGEHLVTLLESGIGVGLSKRGYGTTRTENIEDGEAEVVQEYDWRAVDAVLYQSEPIASNAQYEGEENDKEGKEMELTLEKLKEDYPEVYEEVLKEGEESTEEKVTQVIESKLDAINLEKFQESLEDLTEKVNSLEEDEGNEGDKNDEGGEDLKEAEELKGEVKELKESLEEKNNKIEELQEKIEKMETANEIEKYIEEKIEGKKFAEVYRKRLAECESKEEVDEKIELVEEEINTIAEQVDGSPAGDGEVDNDEDEGEEDDEKLTEEQKKQRKLAGIEEEDSEEAWKTK